MGLIIIAIIAIVLAVLLIIYSIKEEAIEFLPAILLIILLSVMIFAVGLYKFRDKGIEKYQNSEIVIKQPVYIYTDINGDTLKVEEGTKMLISKKRANIQ